MKYLPEDKFPRNLNARNIDETIENYLHLLQEYPKEIKGNTPYDFLKKIKREETTASLYTGLTLFESANRIMTDLVILFGIKELLEGKIPEISYEEYIVEYGNENKNPFDITAIKEGFELRGEAFNVAQSYFGNKRRYSLEKLRENNNTNIQIILIYNKDAVGGNYKRISFDDEFHLVVDLDEVFE